MLNPNLHNSNISFNSTQLYKVSVKESRGFMRGFSHVPAAFTEIHHENDKDLLSDLANSRWKYTDYARDLLAVFHKFHYVYSLFAVEVLNDKLPILNRIKTLVLAEKTENRGSTSLYLKFIQSGPDAAKPLLIPRRYKGCGEAAIFGLVKRAQESSLNSIYLESSRFATGFYEKYGFKNNGDAERELEKIKFQDVIDKITGKWQNNKDAIA